MDKVNIINVPYRTCVYQTISASAWKPETLVTTAKPPLPRSLRALVMIVAVGLFRGTSSPKSHHISGLDHGVGHSLLLLYDAKVPRGQKSKEFNDLGHDPSNASTSLFYIMTKYFIFITI